jgi:ABC-2 type transport system ATP-binding protein
MGSPRSRPHIDRGGAATRPAGGGASASGGGASAAAVSVQALARRFGDRAAITDLSFDVAPGELFGIVGPDGAGKTTTLRILAGVLRPTSGDAVVAGVSVARDPEGAKPKLAYMPQRFGLYEDLTVRENIAFYADLYRVPRAERPARLDRLYAFSSLGPFRDRLVGKLSGGMKQKASLCCCLIHQPEVLILDEPTFGVDPVSRRDLWRILHEMAAQGVTIVLSTSYLDEAERCDRVLLLHGGRTLAAGTPAALQRAFAGAIVAIDAHGDRVLRDRLRALPGVRGAALFGTRIHLVLPNEAGERDAVLDRVRAAGVEGALLHTIEPSLEDVFLARVGASDAPHRGAT